MSGLDVSVAGVALASAFGDFSRSQHDVEGLLFGRQSVVSTTKHEDSGEDVTRTTVSLSLHSFHTTGSPFSFYDTAGAVSREDLEKAAKGSGLTLLGWFVFRRETPVTPSIREAAVHRSLESVAASIKSTGSATSPSAGPPSAPGGLSVSDPLLFLCASAREENVSTHGFEYRVFTGVGPPSARTLKPVSLAVHNLTANSESEYQSFSASSQLTMPSRPSATGPSPFHDIVADFGTDRLASVVGEAEVPPEVAELERLFTCTQTQLKTMMRALTAKETEVEALEMEFKRLHAASTKSRPGGAGAGSGSGAGADMGIDDAMPPPPDSPPPDD